MPQSRSDSGFGTGEPARFHHYEHHGLMGTVIDVRISADSEAAADRADEAMVAELQRLERIFSAYDPASELCRWRRGQSPGSSAEFSELMARVLDWQVRSEGRFNPMVADVSRVWQEAADTGVMPDGALLAELAAAIGKPRFEIVGRTPRPTGDCSSFTLNAIAKGYIVDRALDRVMNDPADRPPDSISLNGGGDLAHRGSGSVRVGIENPHRPYDNEPPLTVIGLSNAALATSGLARRGFRVAGRWFGHVIDPRTGWPVDDIASITVVAPDAMTADVVATVAGVLSPAEALAYLDDQCGFEGFVVDREGQARGSAGWADLVVDPVS